MNKKKILIIVGFVISICIIGLSVYKIIETSNKVSEDKNGEVVNKTKVKADLKETSEEENDNDSNTNLEMQYDYKEIVDELMMIFNPSSCTGVSYLSTIYSNNLVNYNNLSNDYKYAIILNLKDINFDDNYRNGVRYKVDEVDKKYYDLFGHDKVIELKKIDKGNAYGDNKISAGGSVLYMEGNYYYAIQGIGCGAGCSYKNGYKIIDTNKNNNDIEVFIKYIYGESCLPNSDKIKIYSVNSSSDLIDTIDYSSDFDINEYIDQYYDQLNTYKWTFKYDNEHKNYYFYSVEKVN